MSASTIMKLAGCVLIIASSAAIGVLKGNKLMYRVGMLVELRNTAARIKNEMTFFRTPMPELLETVAGRTQGDMAGLLMMIAAELKEYGGDDFISVWNRNCELYARQNDLKSGAEQLINLGRCLDDSTLESGKNSLDSFMCELQLVIDEISGGLGEKVRLYRNLGILAGIFAVILLV